MRTFRSELLPEAENIAVCRAWARSSVAFGAIIAVLCLGLAGSNTVHAQVVLRGAGGTPTLVGSDLAVLETKDPRQDLPCQVVPGKAFLGFDLKFHAGFEISVPLAELAGSENLLTILFRVIPEGKKDGTVYLIQKIKVPTLPEDAKGDAYLQGTFDLGEGKYHVDWLMRDRSERVCSHYWDVEASLPAKDKSLEVALPPGEIAPSEFEQFAEEPPIERTATESPLNVKVLVNFAPQNSTAATLQPLDTSALVSILRCISRDPRIARFSLVAFNLKEQKIVYRQEAADHIDFPAIGDALKTLQLGKVDFSKLGNKKADTEFLTELLRKEVPATENRPDALIFAGPKAMLEENVPADVLRSVGEVDYPVFYMNYNLTPQSTPWRDSISVAVKHFRGQEFTITRPRDLWFAVTEMMSKIVKLKTGRRSASASLD